MTSLIQVKGPGMSLPKSVFVHESHQISRAIAELNPDRPDTHTDAILDVREREVWSKITFVIVQTLEYIYRRIIGTL